MIQRERRAPRGRDVPSPIPPSIPVAPDLAPIPGAPSPHPVAEWAGSAPSRASSSVSSGDVLVISHADITRGRDLAAGGFGKVYVATWQYIEVAVKELFGDTLPAELQKMLYKEAAIMAKLRHPNIVTLYGLTLEPNGLVMEYLEGGSLYARLKQASPFDWADRARVAIELIKGLLYLHRMHVLHRDLKSLNVLLDTHGHAKLSDFGLSEVKMHTSAVGQTSSSAVGGTLRWMAPELLTGESGIRYDEACDIYGLVMIFWELVTRQMPHADLTTEAQVLARVLQGKRGIIPEEAPTAFKDAITAGWAQMPSARPQLTDLLERFTQDKALPSASMPDSRPSRDIRHSPAVRGQAPAQVPTPKPTQEIRPMPRLPAEVGGPLAVSPVAREGIPRPRPAQPRVPKPLAAPSPQGGPVAPLGRLGSEDKGYALPHAYYNFLPKQDKPEGMPFYPYPVAGIEAPAHPSPSSSSSSSSSSWSLPSSFGAFGHLPRAPHSQTDDATPAPLRRPPTAKELYEAERQRALSASTPLHGSPKLSLDTMASLSLLSMPLSIQPRSVHRVPVAHSEPVTTPLGRGGAGFYSAPSQTPSLGRGSSGPSFFGQPPTQGFGRGGPSRGPSRGH